MESAKAAQEALSRAIKDYKESEDFEEAVLKGSHHAYWVGFKDYREAIIALYPNLYLSSIQVEAPEDTALTAEEENVPTAEIVLTSAEKKPAIRVQETDVVAATGETVDGVDERKSV